MKFAPHSGFIACLRGPLPPLVFCSAVLIFFMTRSGTPHVAVTASALAPPIPSQAPVEPVPAAAPAETPAILNPMTVTAAEPAPALDPEPVRMPVASRVAPVQPVEPAVTSPAPVRRKSAPKVSSPIEDAPPAEIEPAEPEIIRAPIPAMIESPWPLESGKLSVTAEHEFTAASEAILLPGDGEGRVRLKSATGRLGDAGGGCWLALYGGALSWDGCWGGTVIAGGFRIRGDENSSFSVIRLAGNAMRVSVSRGSVRISGKGENITLLPGDIFEQ